MQVLQAPRLTHSLDSNCEPIHGALQVELTAVHRKEIILYLQEVGS